MLNTKIVVLALAWLLGFVLHMAGSPLHLFLGITLGVFLIDMIGKHWHAQ